MRNFKELKIWQKDFEIAVNTYRLIQSLPVLERFGIIQQIMSAAVSVPSNIAEGSSRTSEKIAGDLLRFR
ncbi:four helix bundle protein [Ilyomonas limi]|uniref:Four helix bundle protein n=1 Tax=Ilyomonas limi TaxID=2575867 RepID=A0A4U3KSV1_9BACT|nr:four helix bundle protein [Ilyomonas limi]TKK65565.1 four helix bundle protein [Ilyomonas limi]